MPALSMGVYSGGGVEDPQRPDTEDEVYYILSGRARLRVAGEDRVAEPGSIRTSPPRSSTASTTSRRT